MHCTNNNNNNNNTYTTSTNNNNNRERCLTFSTLHLDQKPLLVAVCFNFVVIIIIKVSHFEYRLCCDMICCDDLEATFYVHSDEPTVDYS